MPLYDAFISYSHAKDKPVASALQSVIQKLGKPWYRRRGLRLFRDDTSLSATPHLWPSIEQALSQSRHLILITSPEAAGSQQPRSAKGGRGSCRALQEATDDKPPHVGLGTSIVEALAHQLGPSARLAQTATAMPLFAGGAQCPQSANSGQRQASTAVRTLELPALKHLLDLIDGQIISARMITDFATQREAFPILLKFEK